MAEQFKILYKYLKKEHAHSLLSKGIIRLGTLYEYRNIEKHGSVIGDDTEGKKSASMPIDDAFWSKQYHPDFADNFFHSLKMGCQE